MSNDNLPPLQFTKKPVTIEAVEYTGAGNFANPRLPEWIWKALESGALSNRAGALIVKTLEGEHVASAGDWIIQGVKGELYPCKPDIFAMTYAAAQRDAVAASGAGVPAGWSIKQHDDGWIFFKRPDSMRATIAPGEELGSHGDTLHMLMSALAVAPTPDRAAVTDIGMTEKLCDECGADLNHGDHWPACSIRATKAEAAADAGGLSDYQALLKASQDLAGHLSVEKALNARLTRERDQAIAAAVAGEAVTDLTIEHLRADTNATIAAAIAKSKGRA